MVVNQDFLFFNKFYNQFDEFKITGSVHVYPFFNILDSIVDITNTCQRTLAQIGCYIKWSVLTFVNHMIWSIACHLSNFSFSVTRRSSRSRSDNLYNIITKQNCKTQFRFDDHFIYTEWMTPFRSEDYYIHITDYLAPIQIWLLLSAQTRWLLVYNHHFPSKSKHYSSVAMAINRRGCEIACCFTVDHAFVVMSPGKWSRHYSMIRGALRPIKKNILFFYLFTDSSFSLSFLNANSVWLIHILHTLKPVFCFLAFC